MLAQNGSSLIQVSTQGDQLVVDSRLIAAQLGIEHPSLLRTIEKYLDRLQRYSPVRFEIDVVKRPQGGTFNLRYAWLNEKQATLLMTYSRNTDQVLDCKDALVDAFEKAKQIIPQQFDRIKELELQVILANAEKEKAVAEQKVLDTRHYIATALPRVVGDRILNPTVVKEIEYRDRIVKDDQLLNDGSTINKTALCERYEILTKNGKPDFKKLNDVLANAKLPDNAFDETTVIRTNKELKREYLSELDRIVLVEQSRQLYLGE